MTRTNIILIAIFLVLLFIWISLQDLIFIEIHKSDEKPMKRVKVIDQ